MGKRKGKKDADTAESRGGAMGKRKGKKDADKGQATAKTAPEKCAQCGADINPPAELGYCRNCGEPF